MARRTKDEAQKTREAILKAALNCFYEHGVVRTSLETVAKAAGVTRGAVYWHFKDKVDLLRTLADAGYLPYEDLLDRLVAEESDDPLAALCHNCCESLDALSNDPWRRRLLTILVRRCEYVDEMRPLVDRNNACKARVAQRLLAIFRQAAKKGRLSKVWTPEKAALTLQSLTLGFIFNEMDWPKPSRARDRDRSAAIKAFFESLRD